jgi:hypothetical protein
MLVDASPELREKTRKARELGKLVDISAHRVAFDSEKSDLERTAAEEWDSKFERRSRAQAVSGQAADRAGVD